MYKVHQKSQSQLLLAISGVETASHVGCCLTINYSECAINLHVQKSTCIWGAGQDFEEIRENV